MITITNHKGNGIFYKFVPKYSNTNFIKIPKIFYFHHVKKNFKFYKKRQMQMIVNFCPFHTVIFLYDIAFCFICDDNHKKDLKKITEYAILKI